MRKRIINTVQQETAPSAPIWLDLDTLAEVEITSEDAAYPIESALLPGRDSGWRAADPGEQTIRLIFANPQQLRRIYLNFEEAHIERMQEYILRWSADAGKTFQEIVRQQWNFSPQGAISETEDHFVELLAVNVLELSIIPDMSGGNALACLAQLRLA